MPGPNPKGMMATETEERPEVEKTSMEELEIKSKSTFFKVASVSVYISAVFGNGFMLSIFFLFLWDSGIEVERPAGMDPDYGWFGGPSRFIADEMPFPQARKDPQPPSVPYHRIMSSEFTNNYINNFPRNSVPGSKYDTPEPPRALPSYEHEEYDNSGSTVKPASTSPRYTRETNMHVSNIGSEEGNDSTSSSDGGPMAKPKMTGSAITSHQT